MEGMGSMEGGRSSRHRSRCFSTLGSGPGGKGHQPTELGLQLRRALWWLASLTYLAHHGGRPHHVPGLNKNEAVSWASAATPHLLICGYNVSNHFQLLQPKLPSTVDGTLKL